MTVTVVTTVANDIDNLPISQSSSRKSRRGSKVTHYVQAATVENQEKVQLLDSPRSRRRSSSRRKNRSKSRTKREKVVEYRQHRRRVSPTDTRMETSKVAIANGGTKSSRRGRKDKPTLIVDTSAASAKASSDTPRTAASTPASPAPTPAGVRGRRDLRSPGASKTPVGKGPENQAPLPDFITQTDASGNAVTPRSEAAISNARKLHPSGPEPHLHVNGDGKLSEEDENGIENVDACETLLDGIRLMCCCLMPEEEAAKSKAVPNNGGVSPTGTAVSTDSSTPEDDRVKLLPKHHPDDFGKKCLVLDLDETLVHSSFRAVPGADFVIPVQIEDVVHFVYVAKRPGVDEFLVEMAKHYEIVIYTASLNKYADPLLDLLDPQKVIRTRLFRESCVYYEGNYVKDLSLLDRDLSQAIIIDNSPSSYMFHPENAIDCTSFIDDPMDRELDQIGSFLTGIKDTQDVRHLAPRWREWPRVNLKDYETPQEHNDQ
jgi:RNA polymerase II subunit A small phosphatase-like protein